MRRWAEWPRSSGPGRRTTEAAAAGTPPLVEPRCRSRSALRSGGCAAADGGAASAAARPRTARGTESSPPKRDAPKTPPQAVRTGPRRREVPMPVRFSPPQRRSDLRCTAWPDAAEEKRPQAAASAYRAFLPDGALLPYRERALRSNGGRRPDASRIRVAKRGRDERNIRPPRAKARPPRSEFRRSCA